MAISAGSRRFLSATPPSPPPWSTPPTSGRGAGPASATGASHAAGLAGRTRASITPGGPAPLVGPIRSFIIPTARGRPRPLRWLGGAISGSGPGMATPGTAFAARTGAVSAFSPSFRASAALRPFDFIISITTTTATRSTLGGRKSIITPSGGGAGRATPTVVTGGGGETGTTLEGAGSGRRGRAIITDLDAITGRFRGLVSSSRSFITGPESAATGAFGARCTGSTRGSAQTAGRASGAFIASCLSAASGTTGRGRPFFMV